MRARNILWWMGFFYAGICVQSALPGLDALVIGLLLALRERKALQIAWLLPALVLVQEGGGTLDFGASILWYLAVVALFFIGHKLFEVENLLFMFLLSACLGLAHMGIIRLMAALQNAPVDEAALLDEGILQALFIPFGWHLAGITRRILVLSYENSD
ncbi:MAG: hypothetical protein LBC10_00690 [Deltaproteobacteria bacterium]|jgi:hypothetical protein|nr:hypothetical protein [Deltaproteobacteria bacterium]